MSFTEQFVKNRLLFFEKLGMVLLIFFPLPLEKASGNRENHPTDRPSSAGATEGHRALPRSSAEPRCHGGTQVKQQWENSQFGPGILLSLPLPEMKALTAASRHQFAISLFPQFRQNIFSCQHFFLLTAKKETSKTQQNVNIVRRACTSHERHTDWRNTTTGHSTRVSF